MTFTAPEDAKPKIPQPNGLDCLGCHVTDASEWRGPGRRFCARCRKAADEARAVVRLAKGGDVQSAQEARICMLEERLTVQQAHLERQHDELRDQQSLIIGLQREVLRLARTAAGKPQLKHAAAAEAVVWKEACAGAKRPALAELHSEQPPAPALR
jgi:uncharacterized coiled-coil protein SlyX